MKILAKTKGPTLVCSSGDFLDSYKYRLVNYDPQVRGWNNRDLLDISGFVDDMAKNEDLEEMGLDAFLKKWAEKSEPKIEEPKIEEPNIEEPKVEEPKVEEPRIEMKKNRKNKK